MDPNKYDVFALVGQDGQSSEIDQLTRLNEIVNKEYNYYRLIGRIVIEWIIVITCMLRFRHYGM